ncbi:MAG TPA: YhjD/YihY/BrkB family envelope integrity protein [Actinomycetota bacterium]|nr:YhjD/YihY/BrkB family envelope integrity protein [Actinomycetota bacterium]
MDARGFVRRADRFQRRHPAVAFPYAVVKHFGEDSAGNLAATMAYYGFFSLFPLLLVLVTGAALVLRDDPQLQQRLLDSALAQFPIVGEDIRENVGRIEASGLALAIGIVTSIWAGLGGIRSAQYAMETVWDVPYVRRPSTPKAIARAFVMLAAFGVFILGAAVLASVAGGVGLTVLGVLAWVGSVLLNIALFLVLYRVLTTAHVSWSDVLPGGLVAGIGWTALLALGGWIIGNRLEGASNTYGFFAVVIGLLAWLHLGSQLTIVGAEVNVVRRNRLWPRALDADDMTEADRRTLRRFAKQETRREDEIVSVHFENEGRGAAGSAAGATPDGDATMRAGVPNGSRSTGPAGPPPWAEQKRSLGDIIRSVVDGATALMRKEIELAKIELAEAVAARGKGIGMMAAAGVFGLFALGFAAAAGSAALERVVPDWAAHLIVAAVFVLLALVLFLVGRAAMRATPVAPEKTQATIRDDVRLVKERIGR